MSIYQIGAESFVNTANAQLVFQEQEDHDGHNMISRATRSQWEHETLYLSKKGIWFIELYSQRQGSPPSARLLTPRQAAVWLKLMKRPIPDCLADEANAAEA